MTKLFPTQLGKHKQLRSSMDRLGLNTLPHPPYSSDFTLKVNHYENVDAVEIYVHPWRCGNEAEFYPDGIQQPIQQCRTES